MGKRNKNFLPKRVGRLKIPKRLRRGVVGAAIGSVAGQAVIAALVLQIGAHLGRRVGIIDGAPANGADRRTGRFDAASDNAAASASPAEPSRTPTLNVKHALGRAALAFIVGLAEPKGSAPRPRRRRPAPEPPDDLDGTAAPTNQPEPETPPHPVTLVGRG